MLYLMSLSFTSFTSYLKLNLNRLWVISQDVKNTKARFMSSVSGETYPTYLVRRAQDVGVIDDVGDRNLVTKTPNVVASFWIQSSDHHGDVSETVKKCFRQTESSASSWRVLESRNKSNGIKMCCLLKYFWAKNDDNFSKRHRDDNTKRHKDNVVTKLKLSQSFLTCVTHACCVKTLAFLAVAVVIFCLFGNPSNESSTPVTAVTHGSRLDIVRFIFADDVPSRAMRSGINSAKTSFAQRAQC